MRSKGFFLLLITVLATGWLVPAQGDPLQRSLVIIDTGFDTSLPIIKDAIVYESCIMNWLGCPDGSSFQEGPGSSALPTNISNTSNMSHGTQMASIAMNTNPGQKIVLIRVIAYNAKGDRMPISDSTVVKVFKWIVSKRTELNIGAVAMAQGYHPTTSGKNYCPNNIEMENDLKEQSKGYFLETFFGVLINYEILETWNIGVGYNYQTALTDLYKTDEYNLRTNSFYLQINYRIK